jgi:hypothetical protein
MIAIKTCTMASRFVVADNDVIELKTSSENLNTRKSTNVLVEVFKKWAGRAALRNIGEDMETYEVLELDKFTINLRINFALYD